jgi:hypothetical protein
MAPADVKRVLEAILIIGADVEQDGKRGGRIDAGACGIERELADGIPIPPAP